MKVSKKVQHDLLPQGASKIQYAKVGSPSTLYFCTVNEILQILTNCKFVTPWDAKACLTFLKISHQYQYGARLKIRFFKRQLANDCQIPKKHWKNLFSYSQHYQAFKIHSIEAWYVALGQKWWDLDFLSKILGEGLVCYTPISI